MADKAIVRSPNGWLTDEIIDSAQNVLHEQFGVPGLQSVIHGQCCHFHVQPDEFVQILHDGKAHWATISTIGAKHTEVFVYDSLHCRASESFQQQVAALLHTNEKAITLRFCKVSMQTNGNDCGVYAVAYATKLCLGASPTKLLFDESKMRPHLIKRLENGQFTMFPANLCKPARRLL